MNASISMCLYSAESSPTLNKKVLISQANLVTITMLVLYKNFRHANFQAIL